MKLSKNILFAAAFLLLIFICVFVLSGKKGKTAEIYCGGKLYKSIDLSRVERDYTIDINGTNTALVSKGKICINHAECPDKLCVRQGWIFKSGYPIVCLPNEVIIKITE